MAAPSPLRHLLQAVQDPLSTPKTSSPSDQEILIAVDPERFYRPAYLGRHGWISIRLDLPPIDWDQVAELITDGYRLVAPKRLAGQVA